MTEGRESTLYSNEYVQKGDTDPDHGNEIGIETLLQIDQDTFICRQ